MNSQFQNFIANGYVEFEFESDAERFAGLLIWKEIPFVVNYDSLGKIVIRDIRDDGR